MTSATKGISKYDLPPVPYFTQKDYLVGDFSQGTLRTKSGRRVIVLPQELLQGLHKAIEFETGRSWQIVAYTCGKRWGQRFFQALQDEWRTYYRQSMEHAEFHMFEAWLSEFFRFQGWGELDFDFTNERYGVVDAYLGNSILDALLSDLESPWVNEIFAGFIAAFVSRLAGRDLDCLETECLRQGAARSRLTVALPERVDQARKIRTANGNPDAVLAALFDKKH